MRPICALASQISTIRKNQEKIYFFVTDKWNTLSLTERLQINYIFNMFMIHILFSDEEDQMNLPYSPFLTQVDHDIWRVISLNGSDIKKDEIKVSFDQIRESLKSMDFWDMRV